MGREIHPHSLAGDILKAVGNGALAVSLLVAPNAGLALRLFAPGTPSSRRRRARQLTQEALARLRRRRLVRLEKRKDGLHILITEKGKERLRTFDFDTMRLSDVPRRWDQKWRIVIFDIPETKQRERKIFRDKLRELGFLALQKSVFVYPYHCQDELDFLCQFLDIDRNVHYIEANALGNAEGKTRRYFALI